MSGKEVAKFFSGVAANQVLTHGALAMSGVQFAIFGIAYTQGLNAAAAVVWAIVLVVLAYYGWGKR